MANQIIEQAKVNMGKTEESLQRELGNIRAGRANASLLNHCLLYTSDAADE